MNVSEAPKGHAINGRHLIPKQLEGIDTLKPKDNKSLVKGVMDKPSQALITLAVHHAKGHQTDV